ncbi:anti-sigma factor family protein [Cupriavidus sp. 30B13]|uniref:anti-sigma factor family protein n=1 Tax=Cupriavidus sp. 30B13 TaxID=3384241 RepID=UPI003B90E9C3
MDCDEIRLLLQACADGELGAGDTLGVERHLAQCPACSAQLAQLRAMRAALRAHAPYHRAGPALRLRLLAALEAAPAGGNAAAPPRGTRDGAGWWQPLRRYFAWGPAANAAMAAVTVAALGIGIAQYALRDAAGPTVEREMVSSHVRALLSGHAIDVASSDRHTVKPWFNGRLDYAPPVRDLAAQGFPLAGGRLDYVHGRAVAVLVYRDSQHPIDVFVLPLADEEKAARAGPAALPPAVETHQGYQLARWEADGMRYAAVTDASADDLLRFTRAWRAAADGRAR